VFSMLDFVYEGTPDHYGYYDNRFLEYEHSVRWYRIALPENGVVGFVDADSVTVNGLPTLSGIQPKTNAQIIEPGGAPVYIKVGENYVEDTLYGPLDPGKRIYVDTPFDSSKEYTRVSFATTYGLVEDRYVKTAHIKYDGPNILIIIVVCAIILVVLISIVIIVRYLSSKRRRQVLRAREPE